VSSFLEGDADNVVFSHYYANYRIHIYCSTSTAPPLPQREGFSWDHDDEEPLSPGLGGAAWGTEPEEMLDSRFANSGGGAARKPGERPRFNFSGAATLRSKLEQQGGGDIEAKSAQEAADADPRFSKFGMATTRPRFNNNRNQTVTPPKPVTEEATDQEAQEAAEADPRFSNFGKTTTRPRFFARSTKSEQ
jgi:hypothetical protein